MRGNRRYVMSRTNRRAMAPVVDDEDSSVASVDTNYLRKLIKTGDTGFIDELLVGGNGDNHYKKEDDADTIIQQGTADDLKYNTSVNKQPKRWPYVVFGMGLMYVILVLWEGRNNRAWWNSYMTDLKSSQSATTMDSYFASRGSAGGGITVNAYDDVNAVDPLYSNSYNTAGGTTNSQGYGTTTTGLRGGQQQSASSSIFKTPTWQQPANNNQQQTYQQQPQQTKQQYQQQPQQQQQQQYPQIAGGLSSGTLGVGSTSNSNTGRSSLQSRMMNTGRSTGSSSSILPLFSNNQQQRSTSSTDETQPLWSGSGTTTNSNRALATGSTTTTTLNNGGSNMNSLYSSSGGGSTASLQGGGGNMNTLYNNGGGGGGSMNSLYSGGNNIKSAGSTAGGQQQLNSQQFGGAPQQLHP